MLKSPLFWKVFASFAAFNLLAVVVLVRLLLGWQEHSVLRQAPQRLQSAAVLLDHGSGDALSEGRSGPLQARIARLGREAGLRLTLIDAQGLVLADSECDGPEALGALENHATRPEVQEALRTGHGTDFRESASVGGAYAYFARRVTRGGATLGVVRAAMPMELLENELDSLRGVVMTYSLAAVPAILLLSYAVASHLARPVLTINDAAQALAHGDYGRRAFVTNRDELGTLADSFNRLSRVLGDQFAALRESGERQALVLGGMIEGVIAIDKDERVVFANGAAGKLFGFLPPQAEGRPLLESVRNHTLHQAVSQSLASGEPKRLEMEWQGGGERLVLAVQISPLPGRPSQGAVVVLHDTTELRRLETIRQEFVANVSHELKTPLSSIKAYAETLLNGALHDQENATRFLQRIDEQADRLTALIHDLLSLARIESEQQPFEIGPIAVSEAVAACLEDYRPAAGAKQIELAVEAQDPQLCVNADAEGLRVILNNLVDNAVKYTPEGGRVTIRWGADRPGFARLEVSDTGMGIPADQLPRVFERFYRVDKARSRELGGTGLGLSIVKHLVQAFGGAVSATSKLGRGTTFRIVLPTA